MFKKCVAVLIVITIVILIIELIAIGVLYLIERVILKNTDEYEIFYYNISENEVCFKTNNYSALKKSIKFFGNSSHTDSNYSFELKDHVIVSIGELNGLMTISRSMVGNKDFSLKVKSELKSGQLRIFVIKNDLEIIKEIFPNEQHEINITSQDTDTYTIKVLALAANMKIEVERID